MNAVVVLTLLVTSILTTATATANVYKCTPTEVNPPSDAFCTDPPVVPVDLPTYQGTWFLTFASDAALRFGGDACTTANYTLNARNQIDVLNCAARQPAQRPFCARAVAAQRANTTASGKLQVSFPSAPRGLFNPARYSVAALLGWPRFGYLAAAVYQCAAVPNAANQSGFFILSRTLRFRALILYLLKLQLACAGYDVNVHFVPNNHTNCTYFFDRSGFVQFGAAGPPMPPPPASM
ncbi:hypothetical protein BWQ96_05082 [Gracilariopsis chorda]|uniref:Lipocalin/cytosolic fatty-acid binding domain-containing protein n=1 Tax=Gracilariopsis chorda TaxID=448386 RepID=A0A2V3IST4_9FLOR|nr:hypothetical protein BWQ96_05082 [Gracilariopsis chorda]|eukprot:PXF45181.1 hypothetical protein BWQ96_05082 [Gracilariopsis chorda]